MSHIRIFKTHYGNRSYYIELSREPGILPLQIEFDSVNGLREYLDHRLSTPIGTEEIIRRLSLIGHVELEMEQQSA